MGGKTYIIHRPICLARYFLQLELSFEFFNVSWSLHLMQLTKEMGQAKERGWLI